MDAQEALESFKGSENVAANTLHAYQCAISSLLKFGQGLEDTKGWTRANLTAWIQWRKKNDVQPQTINTQLAGILSIASHLERAGRFPLKRLQQIRRLRLRGVVTPEPYYLQRDEVARLRLEAQALNPQLDLAIAFAVFAGLRLNELRKLHAEDLALDGEMPFVRVPQDPRRDEDEALAHGPNSQGIRGRLEAPRARAGTDLPARAPQQSGPLHLARDHAGVAPRGETQGGASEGLVVRPEALLRVVPPPGRRRVEPAQRLHGQHGAGRREVLRRHGARRKRRY